MLSTRDVNGVAQGFLPVGNVSALDIAVTTTTVEHKESYTGVRGIDLVLPTEIKGGLNMTMESVNHTNLGLALYGASSSTTTGTVTLETITPTVIDSWYALAHVNVSAVVLKDIATGMTTYVLGTDYEVDTDSGMVHVLTGGAIAALGFKAAYSYGASSYIDGMLSSAMPERWMRFMGLNTAEGNNPVIVDVFRFGVAPLKQLSLISEKVEQMAVDGIMLADNNRVSGSKYFRVQMLGTA
jgi:hypothetical protein